jgi:ribonuclease PH
MAVKRADGREAWELRPLSFRPGFLRPAPGSCLVEWGGTRVLCTATLEAGVPAWLAGRGKGWLTAEYGMLPGSTDRRKPRDGRRTPGVDGRTAEIQRLIGRSFRPVVDLAALGENTLYLDCDVLEADGGTRVAAINGAYVALRAAARNLRARGTLTSDPVRSSVAAVSAGVVKGAVLVDLAHAEDQGADADMNVVMAGDGRFLEVQATAEGSAFSIDQLHEALRLATEAIARIRGLQEEALAAG